MAEQLESTSSMCCQSPKTAKSSQNTPSRQSEPQEPAAISGFPPGYSHGYSQASLVWYPMLVQSLNVENHEQVNRASGLYAVPVFPRGIPIAGAQPNTLIPLAYNIPNTRLIPEASNSDGHVRRPQQQQQQAPPQRVFERRFQIAIQLDLLLILKLAVAIFLFNQDGSRQRLLVLVFFASLIYLHRTGALTPLARWVTQSMQRAVTPPRPPGPVGRAQNAALALPVEGRNRGGPGNENQQAEEGNEAVANNNAVEQGNANGGNQWWGIVKEIQIIIFGFITSLLPGFHNID